MKKTVKIILLLLVILAALVIASHFVSFDLLVRKLHGGRSNTLTKVLQID